MSAWPNVVVCGYPRAGTTLLYNMLRATCTSHRFFDREISAVAIREPDGWISKEPGDRRFSDEQLRAERIVCVRDPRDVLCSRHSSRPDSYKIAWDKVMAGKTGQMRVRTEGLLEIDQQCQAIEDAALLVSYEELVRKPQRVQKRIGKRFRLSFAGSFDRFHEQEPPPGLAKQLNGLRPVSSDRVGIWREHRERIRQQFAECPALQDVLVRRGYERDARWLERL